jgi:hypothetical protein
MSKLTAKLSDGTEWEVDILVHQRDGTKNAVLQPLKPSPPKEVWIVQYSDGSISASYRSAEEAEKYTVGFSGTSKPHRYVLAEEPKEQLNVTVENICKRCNQRFDYLCVHEGYVRNLCAGCLGNHTKPQPREWWCVYDDKLGIHHLFAHEASARLFHEVDKTERDTPFHVREVLK